MIYKISNASIGYGSEVLIDKIFFDIKDKDKIGLVGRNGCGKTSFFKALLGQLEFDKGSGDEKFFILNDSHVKFGILNQINFVDETKSIKEDLMSLFKDVLDCENLLNELVKKIEINPSKENITQYSETLERFKNIGGYTLKRDFQNALKGFGFDEEDQDRPLNTFSGGEKTRIALIKLFLSKPDILLLDEPTNNLDLNAIQWLESYLRSYEKPLVLISHDRMFLDRVVNKIYEIEYGEMTHFNGNYSAFYQNKQMLYEKFLKDSRAQKLEKERLNRLVEKFIYKPAKAKFAKNLRKRIERMDEVIEIRPNDTKSFKAKINPSSSPSNPVLALQKVQIGFGDKCLAKTEFTLIRGRKLGIIGENGSGKTTLINTILGNTPQLAGKILIGNNVKFGYFDQSMLEMNDDISIYDSFDMCFPNQTPNEIYSCLGAFNFKKEDCSKKCCELSGGEKVRFLLAKIFKLRPNVLIMDEPTNYLDIYAKEALEQMLSSYIGTLVLISHDRYFVNKICDCILYFENNKAVFYDMKYMEFEAKYVKHIEYTDITQQIKSTIKTAKVVHDDKRLIKKEMEKLAREIDAMQKEIKDLEEGFEIEEIYSDYFKCKELKDQIDEIQIKLEVKQKRWEELLEKSEDL